MANLTAKKALQHVSFGAFICFMADLVALEAEFCVAVKGIMRILATQNAVEPTSFVRALFRQMSKFFAMTTL
jgi:hypothetical protein